jgi:hypothetical protein
VWTTGSSPLLRQIVQQTLRNELPVTADSAVDEGLGALGGLLEQAE